jgi:hypothetical protein
MIKQIKWFTWVDASLLDMITFVHDFVKIQTIGKNLLVQFKGVFPKEIYKNYETESRKT